MLTSNQIHICDVCRLLDSDTNKKLCGYCGLCDAFICMEDMNRWDRRLRAAVKRKLEPGSRVQEGYIESIEKDLAAKGGQ